MKNYSEIQIKRRGKLITKIHRILLNQGKSLLQTIEQNWEIELNTTFNDRDWKETFHQFSSKSVSRGLQEHALKMA